MGTAHAVLGIGELGGNVLDGLKRSPIFLNEVGEPRGPLPKSVFFYEDGTEVRNLISKEAWTKLVEVMGKEPPPDARTSMLYFNYQRALLEKAIDPKELGLPLDGQLLQFAKDQHRVIRSLEEPIASYEYIGSIVKPEFLEWTILNLTPDEFSTILKTHFALNRAGDATGFARYHFQMATRGTGGLEFFHAITTTRNLNWMDAIERAHEEGPAFIAVGAAHLFFENGLLALLAKRGFQLSRLPAAEPVLD